VLMTEAVEYVLSLCIGLWGIDGGGINILVLYNEQ
jgi:hypothetical protein